jgi:8-oxo-dGTP diphosphatase
VATIIVSVVAFYDERRRVLLQGRKGIERFGEEWSFFGGRLQPGEVPERGAVRDVEEELDFELDDLSYLTSLPTSNPDGDQVIRHVFISPLQDKLLSFRLKEGSEMRLFTLAEAKQLKMLPNDHEIIALLEKTL